MSRFLFFSFWGGGFRVEGFSRFCLGKGEGGFRVLVLCCFLCGVGSRVCDFVGVKGAYGLEGLVGFTGLFSGSRGA